MSSRQLRKLQKQQDLPELSSSDSEQEIIQGKPNLFELLDQQEPDYSETTTVAAAVITEEPKKPPKKEKEDIDDFELMEQYAKMMPKGDSTTVIQDQQKWIRLQDYKVHAGRYPPVIELRRHLQIEIKDYISYLTHAKNNESLVVQEEAMNERQVDTYHPGQLHLSMIVFLSSYRLGQAGSETVKRAISEVLYVYDRLLLGKNLQLSYFDYHSRVYVKTLFLHAYTLQRWGELKQAMNAIQYCLQICPDSICGSLLADTLALRLELKDYTLKFELSKALSLLESGRIPENDLLADYGFVIARILDINGLQCSFEGTANTWEQHVFADLYVHYQAQLWKRPFDKQVDGYNSPLEWLAQVQASETSDFQVDKDHLNRHLVLLDLVDNTPISQTQYNHLHGVNQFVYNGGQVKKDTVKTRDWISMVLKDKLHTPWAKEVTSSMDPFPPTNIVDGHWSIAPYEDLFRLDMLNRYPEQVVPLLLNGFKKQDKTMVEYLNGLGYIEEEVTDQRARQTLFHDSQQTGWLNDISAVVAAFLGSFTASYSFQESAYLQDPEVQKFIQGCTTA